MTPLESLVKQLTDEIDQMKKALSLYESGAMRMGQKEYGGPWVDITDVEAGKLRGSIANLESLVTEIESTG